MNLRGLDSSRDKQLLWDGTVDYRGAYAVKALVKIGSMNFRRDASTDFRRTGSTDFTGNGSMNFRGLGSSKKKLLRDGTVD